MSSWRPPPNGTPTWLSIPATDVARDVVEFCAAAAYSTTTPASKFYEEVFKLPYKEGNEAEAEQEIRLFDLNKNGLNIGGGILKIPDETGAFTGGNGGICIHWFVDDIETSSKAIEAAGGKMLSESVKQGSSGAYRYFEDTEGTVGSIYMLVK